MKTNEIEIKIMDADKNTIIQSRGWKRFQNTSFPFHSSHFK